MAAGAQGDSESAEALAERLREVLEPSSVIVCIGHELAGDDAAGVAVGRAVAGELPWQVVQAQNAPESFLMRIVAAEPASVLLVDALHFAGAPGDIRLLDAAEIVGDSPSTHGPSLATFLSLLKTMHSCPTWLLGIQPAGVEMGAALSAPVRRAVEQVLQAFRAIAGAPRRRHGQ